MAETPREKWNRLARAFVGVCRRIQALETLVDQGVYQGLVDEARPLYKTPVTDLVAYEASLKTLTTHVEQVEASQRQQPSAPLAPAGSAPPNSGGQPSAPLVPPVPPAPAGPATAAATGGTPPPRTPTQPPASNPGGSVSFWGCLGVMIIGVILSLVWNLSTSLETGFGSPAQFELGPKFWIGIAATVIIAGLMFRFRRTFTISIPTPVKIVLCLLGFGCLVVLVVKMRASGTKSGGSLRIPEIVWWGAGIVLGALFLWWLLKKVGPALKKPGWLTWGSWKIERVSAVAKWAAVLALVALLGFWFFSAIEGIGTKFAEVSAPSRPQVEQVAISDWDVNAPVSGPGKVKEFVPGFNITVETDGPVYIYRNGELVTKDGKPVVYSPGGELNLPSGTRRLAFKSATNREAKVWGKEWPKK